MGLLKNKRPPGIAHALRVLSRLLATTILLFCAPACFAEHPDRSQPLFLEADQLLIEGVQQTSIFTGNVQLTQGSMQIRGDKVEVIKYQDGFQQAKIYGNAASFRQKREGSEEYMEGYGERIEYDTGTGMVNFYVRARVKRDLDEVRGDHITYNMKTDTFQVSSAPSSAGSPPQRVRAILQPKLKTGSPVPSPQNVLPATPNRLPVSPE